MGVLEGQLHGYDTPVIVRVIEPGSIDYLQALPIGTLIVIRAENRVMHLLLRTMKNRIRVGSSQPGCSSNLPLPSSIHISSAKAPDSRFRTGVVFAPPRSLPILELPCTSVSLLESALFFLCFCRVGSAAIQGVFGPKGASTPASSRSSVIRVKEHSEGSGLRDDDRVESVAMVARNCSGRSVAGGVSSVKEVRSSEDGTDGNAAVENT